MAQKSTKILSGVTISRIFREPYDAEFVHETLSNLTSKLDKSQGMLYDGLLTVVTSDPNKAYNGLYLISEGDDGDYIATKMSDTQTVSPAVVNAINQEIQSSIKETILKPGII